MKRLLCALCFALLMLVSSLALADQPVMLNLNGAATACSAPGVSVDGQTVTLSAPGEYVLTGELDDGCIVVQCAQAGKITLFLNGVRIHHERGPAIWVKASEDRVSISTLEGTENFLSGGAVYDIDEDEEPNGVIFSRSDTTITGSGSLSVTAECFDGIVSKDDLRIKGGTLQVNAKRNGIRGKDGVEIYDGVITVVAGKDGLRSTNTKDPDRGYVEILGGSVTITCGDDPIDAVTRVTVTGGEVNALIVPIEKLPSP